MERSDTVSIPGQCDSERNLRLSGQLNNTVKQDCDMITGTLPDASTNHSDEQIRDKAILSDSNLPDVAILSQYKRRASCVRTNSRNNAQFMRDIKAKTDSADVTNICAAPDECDEISFLLPESTHEGSESGRMVHESWPMDHVMLLYMLSRYAMCAKSLTDTETWIRQIPLIVLMYEGIAAGVLNFDYAPATLQIAQDGRPRRIWINASQDGKSAIDDLREADLINGLKLLTRDYHSVTAFQVSLRGIELLKQVGKDIRAKVDEFIFAPKPYRHELLQIRYIPVKEKTDTNTLSTLSKPNPLRATRTEIHLAMRQRQLQGEDSVGEAGFNEEGRFILESVGYFRYSQVTDTEDVSYVSSPFLPQCVRASEASRILSSNADRAAEAAKGQSNIRDTLSEVIVLSNPVCLVGEWIPFGSNQIVALNERLGSMDRCQGGLFTSLIDDCPTDTQFEVPPGLTQVRIMDYDPVRYINFEAEINFPEDEGIVQVESFGIHLHVDGTIFYGIRVNAILDKLSDRISIDLLSRLLVDIHQDSSQAMDDLLSSYQTSLLDMVYLGDIANRGKFNMILADRIDPFMPGLDYLDRGDYENELKQVLGDLQCAYDIGEDSVLMLGRDGMLIAGSAGRRFERVFISYFSMLCREMFLRNFFTRIFILEEQLKQVRELIFHTKEDPNHLNRIRAILSSCTNDLILFTDTLGYLLESLEILKIPVKSANPSEEEEAIFSYLDLQKQHYEILSRARDLEKLVHGAKYQIIHLRQMTEVLNTTQLEDIFKSVECNTKELADQTSQTIAHSHVSLELTCVLLAASFSFTLLDRLFDDSIMLKNKPTWAQSFYVVLNDIPLVFFLANIAWMTLFVYVVFRYKQMQKRKSQIGHRILRVKVNKRINIAALHQFLSTRPIQKQDSTLQPTMEFCRVRWHEIPGYGQAQTESSNQRDGVKSASVPDARHAEKKALTFRTWKAYLFRLIFRMMDSWKKQSEEHAAIEIVAEAARNAAANAAMAGAFGLSKPNNIRSTSDGVHADNQKANAMRSAQSFVSSAATAAALLRTKTGSCPIQIEMEYDSHIAFLLNLTFSIHLEPSAAKQYLGRNRFLSRLWHVFWLRIAEQFNVFDSKRGKNLTPGTSPSNVLTEDSAPPRIRNANRASRENRSKEPSLRNTARKRGRVAPGASEQYHEKMLELEQEILLWFAQELKEHHVIPNVHVII